MKSLIKKYLLLAVLLALPSAAWSQGRIYTKKARLEDFPARTTRVVLSGSELMDAVLTEEVTSRWRISPFEFCSVADYLAEKESGLYYFLHFTKDEDFTYLTVSKGGRGDDPNPLLQGFDVIMVPVAPATFQPGDDLVFLPAYLDIAQEFIVRAQESEKVAFRGLKGICTKAVGKIYFDPEEGVEAFLRSQPDGNAIVRIEAAREGVKGYEMMIATDTHLLCGFKRK